MVFIPCLASSWNEQDLSLASEQQNMVKVMACHFCDCHFCLVTSVLLEDSVTLLRWPVVMKSSSCMESPSPPPTKEPRAISK